MGWNAKQLPTFKKPAGIYLLSHSVGCLPSKVEDIVSNHYFQPWKTKGGEAWDTWIKSIDSFKHSLAYLFSANTKDFCPQNNVSAALVKILLSLPNRPQKKSILVSEHDFSSTIYSLTHANLHGHKIKFISLASPVYDLEIWNEQLRNDIDIVFITHVTSDISQQAPVQKIIQLAKKYDVITIVDIAQSAGVIPINITQWDADFVVGSCVKWLCGGPGAGFMWVNPEILKDCKPRDVGWFSHANPFEFDVHHFEYASDARRFWGGTPSILPFVIADEAIKQITQIGVHNIYKHNQSLINIIKNVALEQKFQVMSPQKSEHRGGTITIEIKNVDKAIAHLKKNQVFYDIRQHNFFRFSPHIYTTMKDVEVFVKILGTQSAFAS